VVIVFYLALIFFFSFLLVKATDILIVNFRCFSQKTRLGKFALTGLILGLATSLPELFVGLSSAFEKQPILSLGNIMGANIANLSLVIGGAALVVGVVNVKEGFIRRDIFYAFLAASAPMVLLVDRFLSRIDGLILLVFYLFYQVVIFSERRQKLVKEKVSIVKRLLRKVGQRKTQKELAWIFLAIILLLVSADVLVRLASKLAVAFNLPLLLIGLLIVAVGTTLPELVFSIKALKGGQKEMFFGNLLGSIVANGTLVIGLVALISPFHIQAFSDYLLATMVFLVIFGILFLFIKTKRRLERWEGAVLLIVYLFFIFLETF